MRFLLLLFGSLGIFFGFAVFNMAKSAVHEIEAGILMLIGVVLFVGACVVSAIETAVEKLGVSRDATNGED